MQRSNVLRKLWPNLPFLTRILRNSEDIWAQQKSPLLNFLRWRAATFSHVAFQMLCMMCTHRYGKINTGIRNEPVYRPAQSCNIVFSSNSRLHNLVGCWWIKNRGLSSPPMIFRKIKGRVPPEIQNIIKIELLLGPSSTFQTNSSCHMSSLGGGNKWNYSRLTDEIPCKLKQHFNELTHLNVFDMFSSIDDQRRGNKAHSHSLHYLV